MPKKDLTIHPVKVDRKRLGEIKCGPILPCIPHLILCTGHVKAGKTTVYNNLYLNPDFYGDHFDMKVIISPTAHSDEVNTHLVKIFDYVIDEVDEDAIRSVFKDIEEDDSDMKWIIILDDIVGSLPQPKSGKLDVVSEIATKYRHIGNDKGEGKLSMFVAVQSFMYLTPTLRNNCSGYIICGSNSESELKALSQGLSYFGGTEKKFKDLVKKSRKKDYDFLFLNTGNLTAYRNFKDKLWEPENK